MFPYPTNIISFFAVIWSTVSWHLLPWDFLFLNSSSQQIMKELTPLTSYMVKKFLWIMFLKSPSPSGDTIHSSQCNACHAAFPVTGVFIRCVHKEPGNLKMKSGGEKKQNIFQFKKSRNKSQSQIVADYGSNNIIIYNKFCSEF